MNEQIKKLEKYLDKNYLENSSYKDIIIDLLLQDQSCFITSQKRDECGFIAITLELFAKEKGVHLKRVRGEFLTDTIQLKKLDFFKEELTTMIYEGLDPNKKDDRMTYVIAHNLEERQKMIPHYWNEDENGNIVDLSGYSQFVLSGFAKDLNIDRYIKEEPKNNLKVKM